MCVFFCVFCVPVGRRLAKRMFHIFCRLVCVYNMCCCCLFRAEDALSAYDMSRLMCFVFGLCVVVYAFVTLNYRIARMMKKKTPPLV